jgi:hypothetical protein
MTDIKIHTFPEGQQLSEGEIVQIRKRKSGRWVFRDCYFADLQDGDEYIIPQQAELPLASDTEILDFLVKNKGLWSWTITDFITGDSSVHAFRVSDLTKLAERRFKTGDTPALLGSFRELFSELIHNEEL